MREIKFRGYQEALEEFVYGSYLYEPKRINGQTIEHWIVRDDGFKYAIENGETIGQLTGLKDKNGREIYEGDILKVIPSDSKHYPISIFVVRKIESAWGDCYSWEHVSGYECSTHIMEWDYENNKHLNVDIIGNIYEHKHLLEETS